MHSGSLAVVAELSRRREADDAAVGAWTSQLGEFVPAEVGVGLTVSKGVASAFVSTGQILDDRLPAIRAAFARGELDYARVRVIVERTAHVEDTSIAEVERRILDTALKPGRELVRGRLANAIDRIITALDPDGARERRKRAEADRDVQVRPDADGMCSLWGALTGVGGRALEERLREMAIGVCGSDPRTVSQRRADALTALALGIDHLACTCVDPGCPCIPEPPAKPRALIQVMIDAATLAGGADLPGVLGGLGIVDPELVRELAADASWQQLLTDTQGAVTGVGPTIAGGAVPACRSRPWRYSPSATLARLVRARDGQMPLPGMRGPSASLRPGPCPAVQPCRPAGGWSDHGRESAEPLPLAPPAQNHRQLAGRGPPRGNHALEEPDRHRPRHHTDRRNVSKSPRSRRSRGRERRRSTGCPWRADGVGAQPPRPDWLRRTNLSRHPRPMGQRRLARDR